MTEPIFPINQPHAGNQLLSKYPDEVQAILAKYSADGRPDQRRSAVMPLLYLAQRKSGYVTKQALTDIAELIGITPTDVASLVGFYTLYHDQPAGKFRIQVCTDLPCALRGAEEFLDKLCENLGIQVGETTPDGLVTVEAVMCLAGCDRAPLFQVQSGDGLVYHENQTVESAMKVIDELRASAKGTPAAVEAEAPVSEIAARGISQISLKERVQIQLGEQPKTSGEAGAQ